MDLFNRPPSISEDTLHYTIYPPQNLTDKSSVSAFAACLTNFAQTLLPDFLWHRDSFEVKLIQNPDSLAKWVLEGRMRVGDCVDDEWCTVWLLKEISSQWDAVISVYDSDGEFLLIEAAEALPSWVQPNNSENRVWIYDSGLHLISLALTSSPSKRRPHRKLPGAAESDDEGTDIGDRENFIAAEDAVKYIRDPTINTLAPPAVEKIVWHRISGYPTATKSHVHTTKAHIPVAIATALAVNPALIQKAVEAFYTRDAIQLRVAHRMARFPPDTSILTAVKMTRTAYAQIVGQKFFPPKVFGKWIEREATDKWRWRDVGMKIAVGFEILYQENKSRGNSEITADNLKSATEAQKEALRRNPEYQKYIRSMMEFNYFKGELQGSEMWNKLETQAATTFVEIRKADDATRQSFATQVDSALANTEDLPIFVGQEEDRDDWLSVDPQEFEHMLKAASGGNGTTQGDSNAMNVDLTGEERTEDRIASEQAKKLKDLASRVESFVEGEGDLEGARFEDEEFSDELFSDDEGSEESDSEDDIKPKPAVEQVDIEQLVPALDPSEYGKMPASYHSNSQRTAQPVTKADGETCADSNAKTQTNSQSWGKSPTKPIRPPIIPRDKYDGVDSDDETDEEKIEDEESEEEKPQVVGEIEIDMGEEEEEFLEFSRQALGISDEHWQDIIKDRKRRGAFLPASASKPSPLKNENETKEPRTHTPRVPEPGPRPNVNPDLDSFEAVMKALDEELLKSKGAPKNASIPTTKGKEKATAVEADDDIQDIDAAMEAELKDALHDADSGDEESLDYNLIKNFLESFKSQAGLSGPVSNLAGRLQPEFGLPRDQS